MTNWIGSKWFHCVHSVFKLGEIRDKCSSQIEDNLTKEDNKETRLNEIKSQKLKQMK